jgi:hypothetical protein
MLRPSVPKLKAASHRKEKVQGRLIQEKGNTPSMASVPDTPPVVRQRDQLNARLKFRQIPVTLTENCGNIFAQKRTASLYRSFYSEWR